MLPTGPHVRLRFHSEQVERLSVDYDDQKVENSLADLPGQEPKSFRWRPG